jgi:hypothetical protein
VSALREYALLHSTSQHASPASSDRAGGIGGAGNKAECAGSGGGGGVSRSEGGGGGLRECAEGGVPCGLAEHVEAFAAHVVLAQARAQAEVDLLLLCCHRMSSFLPAAYSCAQHTRLRECGSVGVTGGCGGGWWLRPDAVKSRAIARLLVLSLYETAPTASVYRDSTYCLCQLEYVF